MVDLKSQVELISKVGENLSGETQNILTRLDKIKKDAVVHSKNMKSYVEVLDNLADKAQSQLESTEISFIESNLIEFEESESKEENEEDEYEEDEYEEDEYEEDEYEEDEEDEYEEEPKKSKKWFNK